GGRVQREAGDVAGRGVRPVQRAVGPTAGVRDGVSARRGDPDRGAGSVCGAVSVPAWRGIGFPPVASTSRKPIARSTWEGRVMAVQALGGVVERLTADVKHFASRHFSLAEDLNNLEKVLTLGAVEAAVFYCARILEALAARAIETVGLEASGNVYSDLDSLQQYNLLDTAPRYWAHALRRAGNDARHLLRPLGEPDADLAVLLAERWLEWFFCAFRLRPLLKSVTRDGKPLHPRAGEELRTLMRALEAPQPDLHGVRSSFLVAERASVLSRTPALPSVLAEMLLDRGAEPEALEVLNKAREHFADD